MPTPLTPEHLNLAYQETFATTYHNFRKAISEKEKLSKVMYSMHYPSVGLHYEKGKGMLVVGRALNGWEPRFCSDVENESFLKDCNEYSKENLENGKCPLQWLEEELPQANNKVVLNRSSFWQVAKGVAMGLYPELKNHWTHNLAWSNLYKIAPADGGNPTTFEGNAQWPGVRYLLEMEIAQLQPKYVLFITGKDWAMPFLGELETFKGKYVQETGLLHGAKTVITIRPESKPKEAFVEEVLERFIEV